MSKKIVVVDDDPAILDVTQIILTKNNYEVETSLDGRIFEKIKVAPDLILMDVLLSGEDGRILVRKLRSKPLTKKVPIVMFSAHPSAAETVKRYGANDFIPKPFEIEHFLKVVEKNLIT